MKSSKTEWAETAGLAILYYEDNPVAIVYECPHTHSHYEWICKGTSRHLSGTAPDKESAFDLVERWFLTPSGSLGELNEKYN